MIIKLFIILCSAFIIQLTRKSNKPIISLPTSDQIYYVQADKYDPNLRSGEPPVGRPAKKNGMCYFDIDDTLKTSISDADSIMNECLNNNFDIGIITASNRSINHICNGISAGGLESGSNRWMSSLLCKHFKDTNNLTFNSSTILAGRQTPMYLPIDTPEPFRTGYIKGVAMAYGKDLLYPYMDDKCVVLFDDDPNYIEGVKLYNNNLEVQCANYACGGTPLSLDIVKNKISKMKQNGC